MKTLLLLAAVVAPAIAFANPIVPPAPRIDLHAKPGSLQALKNRAAIIAEQSRIADSNAARLDASLPRKVLTVRKNAGYFVPPHRAR